MTIRVPDAKHERLKKLLDKLDNAFAKKDG